MVKDKGHYSVGRVGKGFYVVTNRRIFSRRQCDMKCLKACILYWYVRDDEVNT